MYISQYIHCSIEIYNTNLLKNLGQNFKVISITMGQEQVIGLTVKIIIITPCKKILLVLPTYKFIPLLTREIMQTMQDVSLNVKF